MKNLYVRRKEWALCYRKNLLVRGQHTNNISEATMKVIKDYILDRLKAVSAVHLLDICTTEFIEFYVDKLVSSANGYTPNYIKRKFKVFEKWLASLQLVENENADSDAYDGLFTVFNQSTKSMHTVDISLGLCTCFVGMTGAICKHAVFVHNLGVCAHHHPLASVPTTEADRMNLFFIATERHDVPKGWFADLNIGHPVPNSEHTDNDNNLLCLQSPVLEDSTTNSLTRKDQQLDNLIVSEEPSVSQEIVAGITHQFQTLFVDDLMRRAQDSSRIRDALSVLVTNYKKCTTEESIVSACSTFGKFNGFKTKKK